MSATTTNGAPARKQLADQIDRLDNILDALGDGLTEAVADAAREGTRMAVKDAILEIMADPELRAFLAALSGPGPAPAPVPKAPGLWSRIKARVTAARDAVAATVVTAKAAVTARYGSARDAVRALCVATGEPLPVRRILWAGLGAGVTIGAACLVIPHEAAAAVSAVSATSTAVVVQTVAWLRTAARRVGLV